MCEGESLVGQTRERANRRIKKRISSQTDERRELTSRLRLQMLLLSCLAVAAAASVDPRLRVKSRDAIRPPPAGKRRPARGEFRVYTREDELFARAAPALWTPQFAVLDAPLCVGGFLVVWRKIPKNASQSLNALLDALRRRHAPLRFNCSTPFVFAFARHPFSRLVSGLNTILRMLAGGYAPDSEARGLPFRRFFAAQVPRSVARRAHLRDDAVRALFERFVADVLGANASAPARGRARSLAPGRRTPASTASRVKRDGEVGDEAAGDPPPALLSGAPPRALADRVPLDGDERARTRARADAAAARGVPARARPRLRRAHRALRRDRAAAGRGRRAALGRRARADAWAPLRRATCGRTVRRSHVGTAEPERRPRPRRSARAAAALGGTTRRISSGSLATGSTSAGSTCTRARAVPTLESVTRGRASVVRRGTACVW